MTGPKRPLLDTAAAASQQRKRRRTSGGSARAEAGTSHQHQQEEEAGQDDQDDQAGGLALASLPQLVLATILDLLSVGDVVRLSQVDRFLQQFVHSRYIPRVTLAPGEEPSSPSASATSTLPPTHNLSVLDLTVTYNVSQLPTDLLTHPPFARLNLRKLKQLRVTGKNHIWNKQYLLSDVYKDTLARLLSSPTYRSSLTRLEILMDESKRSVELVKLLHNFPNLAEVTLHGIGYFDTGSYHMDKDVAQSIISSILYYTSIKVLRLKSFDTLNRCIVIESESLEELHAEFGKHFEIGLLYLPIAKKIVLETSMWAGCFYHAQNGELKKIVSQGCPRLETFNTIDLARLAAASESRHWLDQVGRYCATIQASSEAMAQCVLCCSGSQD